MTDEVNHPPHYTYAPIEVIDVLELFELNYHEGAALKYLLRWRHKGGIQDLEKAIWYLKRLIALHEQGPGSTAPRDLQEELRRSRGFGGEDPEPTSAPVPESRRVLSADEVREMAPRAGFRD